MVAAIALTIRRQLNKMRRHISSDLFTEEKCAKGKEQDRYDEYS